MSFDPEESWGIDASDEELDMVWEILQHHEGKANAITSGELSDMLGGLDNSDSTPKTRKIIRALRHRRKLPIGSGHCGYWVIDSKEELKDTVAQLNRRKMGITATEDAIIAGFEQKEVDA